MTSQGLPGSLLIALIAVTTLTTSCSPQAELAGYTREPTPFVGDVSLPAVNLDQTSFTMSADPEHLLVVYFGYASCPDFCPTTLSDLRLALGDLGSEAERVRVAFVTVDPARDDPTTVSELVEAFVEGGIALRTEDQAVLQKASAAFGAMYRVETDPNGELEVAHSTSTYVVNDKGQLLLAWPFGIAPDSMASDLQILLKLYE